MTCFGTGLRKLFFVCVIAAFGVIAVSSGSGLRRKENPVDFCAVFPFMTLMAFFCVFCSSRYSRAMRICRKSFCILRRPRAFPY